MREKLIWDKDSQTFIPYEKKKVPYTHIMTDEIPGGMRSPVDGKIFTSSTKLRRQYRERGLEEIGNEKLPGMDGRDFIDKGNRRQAAIEGLKLAKENAYRRRHGLKPIDRPWNDRD